MKNYKWTLVTLVFTLFFFSECTKEKNASKTPQIPEIISIVFTSQTDCEINFKSSGESEFEAIAEPGNYTASGTNSPLEMNGLPKGEILEFKILSSSNGSSLKSDYSESSGKKLASVNLDNNVDRIEMLEAINAVRAEGRICGGTQMFPASPLVWDDKLENAAIVHCIDMNTNGFFNHTSESNGSTPGTRIKNEGYDWSSLGENIAKGAPTVSEVMNVWLSSPPHCSNIMSPNFVEVGVAKEGSYWTQVFAR